MKVLVYATLKPDVLDPQGEAIRKACVSMGYEAVRGVRQGKLFDLDLATDDPDRARAMATEIADKLLANTVIEDYRIERVDAD